MFLFKVLLDSNWEALSLKYHFLPLLLFTSSFSLAFSSSSFWIWAMDSVSLWSTLSFSARSDRLTPISCSSFYCVVLTWSPSSIFLVLSLIRSLLIVWTIASLSLSLTFNSSVSFCIFSSSGSRYMLPKHKAKASCKIKFGCQMKQMDNFSKCWVKKRLSLSNLGVGLVSCQKGHPHGERSW